MAPVTANVSKVFLCESVIDKDEKKIKFAV